MNHELTQKIQSVYSGLVVNKRDALTAGLERLPRFVTEFLLASARETNPAATPLEIHEQLRPFFVDADRKSQVISQLMREGSIKIAALLEVEPRPKAGDHIGRIAQLDGHPMNIDPRLVEAAPELLYGGLYGACTLTYHPEKGIDVTQFEPFQLTKPDMGRFKEGRSQFALDEWIALLLASCGYNADAFTTRRQRLLLLTRLIPLTQGSVNLVELGPRGTGKSYLLRSITHRAFLLAGAKGTPASLFYDLNRKSPGIIGKKKAVVFDEVSSTSFPDPSLIAMMKDYMESGRIDRAGVSLQSDCSLIFVGNLEVQGDGQPHKSYTHLFEPLPQELRDTALIDRFHGLIPGWELPKIRTEGLAESVGFLSDYFGEVLTALRDETMFLAFVKERVRMPKEATLRDGTAVHRIASGLLKMLYPDGRIEEDGLLDVVGVAAELRQRVHHQLHRMAPAEFREYSIFPDGVPPSPAPDLITRASMTAHDAEANEKPLVGKLTMLYFLSTGGGGVGFIECALGQGTGLEVTGLRGPSLQESIKAARNAVLQHTTGSLPGVERLNKSQLKVHLVEIAEPKDGPSGGLAFALAMISAATGRPIRPGFACTGELSMMGRVDQVGGIPEKLDAALRHGRKVVVIPAANVDDLAKCSPATREKLEIVPVHTLKEAIDVAILSR